MIRKIKKYLKFVVCLTLIFGLMAPSYAALSASDGSAFITKAEFDSALADFNARLTTFEAGINSKIDSQVTSYLDRNGIWNGKEQSFDNYALVNNFYENFTFVPINDENQLAFWYIPEFTNNNYTDPKEGTITGQYGLSAFGNMAMATPTPGSYLATARIIESCNKSGMMFMNWIARDSARLNGNAGDVDTPAAQGTWLKNVVSNNGGLDSFTNKSKYNTLYANWTKTLASMGSGGGSTVLNGWGAAIAPSMTNAWSSFSLSESVKFHTGYDPSATGLAKVTNLKYEQLLWNYNLQTSVPLLFAHPNYPQYGQYRMMLLGDATQFASLFFVSRLDPVYATIVFTVSGRTPQNAARFITAYTNQKHLLGSIFMLSAYIY